MRTSRYATWISLSLFVGVVVLQIFLFIYTSKVVENLITLLWLYAIHVSYQKQMGKFSPFANPLARFFIPNKKEQIEFVEKYCLGLVLIYLCFLFHTPITITDDYFEKKTGYIIKYKINPHEYRKKGGGTMRLCGDYFITIQEENGNIQDYMTNKKIGSQFLNKKFDIYISPPDPYFELYCYFQLGYRHIRVVQGLYSEDIQEPYTNWNNPTMRRCYYYALVIAVMLIFYYFSYKIHYILKNYRWFLDGE